jgi:hypothetical protein
VPPQGRPGTVRPRLARPGPPAPTPPRPDRARQALDRRQRRDRPRAFRLHLGRDDRSASPSAGRRLNPPTVLLGPGDQRAAGGPSTRSMRSRLATLVRGSSRPDTVLRSRPAHLRVTVVVAPAPAARPHQPP